MKLKLFLSALVQTGNIAVLFALLALSYLISGTGLLSAYMSSLPPVWTGLAAYSASVVLYLAMVLRTLARSEFHDKFNRKQKTRSIQDLNYLSLRLSNEARRHANTVYAQKLLKVMDDKNEIVRSFFTGEKSFLKEKIVEQTLSLVVAYIRLLSNFCIRSRELNTVDVSAIMARISANNRKLDFTKDRFAANDLKKVIEIDEKFILHLKEEKKELERISAKLDYMESVVHMFRHQLISSVESEEMLGKLEEAVNEASALDHVLEERRKQRAKL